MEHSRWSFKEGLCFLWLGLSLLSFIAGRIGKWRHDFAPAWSFLCHSRPFLYLAVALVAFMGAAMALAYRRSRDRKLYWWRFLAGVVCIVFVSILVQGLIDLFLEVRTSRLSLSLALAGMMLLVLAAVLDYRREEQRRRAGLSVPDIPKPPQ